MQKALVMNTEEVTKELGQLTQEKTPEWRIKELKTLGLFLDYLHEILLLMFWELYKN